MVSTAPIGGAAAGKVGRSDGEREPAADVLGPSFGTATSVAPLSDGADRVRGRPCGRRGVPLGSLLLGNARGPWRHGPRDRAEGDRRISAGAAREPIWQSFETVATSATFERAPIGGTALRVEGLGRHGRRCTPAAAKTTPKAIARVFLTDGASLIPARRAVRSPLLHRVHRSAMRTRQLRRRAFPAGSGQAHRSARTYSRFQ
jgi:hypothetical protein